MTNEIFSKNILECVVQLNPSEYNNCIDDTILEKLKRKVEGKCDSYGYIKKDSAKVIKRSIGILSQSDFRGLVEYRVVYSVDICNPVEGMVVNCVVKNINKMGLFCICADYDPSPLSLILAKQHHLKEEKFESVKINDVIKVEIIGVKFNYNDVNISCIGKLRTTNVSMEEELNNEDNLEIELPDNYDTEEDELNKTDESEFGGSDNMDLISDEEELNDSEKEKAKVLGVTFQKDLQKEDDEVLSNMKSSEGGILDVEDISENIDLDNMEGVQDLESVHLETTKINEGELKTEVSGVSDDLELLGEDFEGEKLDLDDISRKDLIPSFNEETFESEDVKVDKSVFDLPLLGNSKYKTFSKPRKNTTKYLNYIIYLQLNNMMIKFYNQNDVEPKKVFLNKKHPYLKQMKEYLSKMGKSLHIEEVDGLSYVL